MGEVGPLGRGAGRQAVRRACYTAARTSSGVVGVVREGGGAMIDGKLSLVLPSHNEEENLRPVVERALEVLPQQCRDWEIVVVDDGSRDATPAFAAALAESNPGRVRVVTHPRNRGYGAALTSGFAAASGDCLMFMD